jgi:hypothetical protein
VEGDDLALGPSAGEPGEDAIGVPVRYETREIAVLEVAPGRAEDEQAPFLEQVAARISLQCLVGWDTGGERWEP